MNYKLAAVLCVALAGCGGGGDDEVLGVATDTVLAANPTVTSAAVSVPFSFAAGVPEFGTSAATSVTFTGAGATPAFSIASDGNTASGTTEFGSCIFRVTRSSFPAGHALANGQTVTVHPCSLSIATTGAIANGQATSRSVALLLGAAASAGASVTVAVNPSGGLTLNGNIVATVTLTPSTGATGGGS